MINPTDITKVKELLDKSQDILIVTHEHPTFDSIGSALSLYLGLAGLGKRVTVACPDDMTVGLSSFVGVNKISKELGKKNFVISLDYVDGSIEKVSYNIENNKFNLVIEPRGGFPPFSQDKVHFSHAGTAVELIFVVDTIHLGGLKKLYEEDKELYATRPIVNIDRHPNNSNYGQINIINNGSSSTAEITAQLLSALGVKLTVDVATNLLNAVYGATNNFTIPNIQASAFEVAAVCVKAGAKRFVSQVTQSEEVTRGGEAVTGTPSLGPKPAPKFPKQPADPAFVKPSYPSVPLNGTQGTEPVPSQPQTQQVTSPAPPTATPSSSQAPGQALPSSGQAPPDWLKPKIFKSNVS